MLNHHHHLETILESYRNEIGKDFDKYRGHCYRILNYMNHLGLTEDERATCSIVIPFHDIGIWTHQTLDYLDVSVEVAKAYCQQHKLSVDHDVIEDLILNHHKLSNAKNELAEKLRKADLIDLSWGIIRFGIPAKEVQKIVKLFPYFGFQRAIMGKVALHAVRNLHKPFPMLRR